MIAWLLRATGLSKLGATLAMTGAAALALLAMLSGARRKGRRQAVLEGKERAVENAKTRMDIEDRVRRDPGDSVERLRDEWSRD